MVFTKCYHMKLSHTIPVIDDEEKHGHVFVQIVFTL